MTWNLVVTTVLPGGRSHRLADEPEADAFIAGLNKSRKIRSSKREEVTFQRGENVVIGWRVDVRELVTEKTEEFRTQALAMKAMRSLHRFTRAQVLRPTGEVYKDRIRCKNCGDETHFSNAVPGRFGKGWCPPCYAQAASFSHTTNADLGIKGIVRPTPFDGGRK